MGKKKQKGITKKKEQNKGPPPLLPGETPNIDFYRNKRHLPLSENQTSIMFLDDIHREWFGNYKLLEQHHSYIQWLFPTTESSSYNQHSYVLQKSEIDAFQTEKDLQQKLITSFRLILDFYGLQILDGNPPYITRHSNQELWKNQFEKHILKSKACDHNLLRISRIIKCLCLCGLSHSAVSFVEYLNNEIEHSSITSNNHPNAKKGGKDKLKDAKLALNKFWIPTVSKYSSRFCQPPSQTIVRNMESRTTQTSSSQTS